MSPEKYIRERARSLEIGKCYINDDWREQGLATVIVTRLHKQGTFTVGSYLVDILCLGVKNSFYFFSGTKEEYDRYISRMEEGLDMVEIDYNEAHNIIYGAVEFAEEGGIKPCKEWNVSKYILEEDDDNIPLIDYEMGKNGKHFLVVHTYKELSTYLPTLRKNLPEDEIDFLVRQEDDDDYESYDDFVARPRKWNHNLVEETVEGEIFDDVDEPILHHPELLGLLDDFLLEKETIDKVLALPHETLREDLEAILRYQFDMLNYDYCPNGTFNAVIFLGEVGDDVSLRLILDSMRMDESYYEDYFGDASGNAYIATLAKLGKNHLDWLTEFTHEPGRTAAMRIHILEVVETWVSHDHSMRDDMVTWLKDLLIFYTNMLPKKKCCDSDVAGWTIVCALHLGAKELLPEIKNLFATGLVADETCGLMEEVVDEFLSDKAPLYHKDKRWSLDIYERYTNICKTFRRNE